MSKNFNIELKSQKSKILIMALCITVLCILAFSITASAETEGYYTYTVTNGEATITDCKTSIRGAVEIPSTLGGYPVTSIGYEAFSGCESLTSITIGNSVTSNGGEYYKGEFVEIVATPAENEESYTVKIMYWNNMTNLMPLNKCESTFVLK